MVYTMIDEQKQLEEENLIALGSKTKEQIEKERLQEAGIVPTESVDQPAPSQFKPAYGGKKGYSTVDLSIQKNEDQMMKEHR